MQPNSGKQLVRGALILAVALAVPLLPFVLVGGILEARIESWLTQPRSPAWAFVLVTGLLSTDIVLPIPSSAVGTMAGAELGTFLGMLATWTGLSIGATVGFWLARWGGPRLVHRLSRAADLETLHQAAQQHGPWLLAVCRAAPVLAEASVLLMGIHQLAWRQFWAPVLLSNLGIAVAYAAFGQFASEHGWLPLALAVTLALPLLVAFAVRWWLRKPPSAVGQHTAR